MPISGHTDTGGPEAPSSRARRERSASTMAVQTCRRPAKECGSGAGGQGGRLGDRRRGRGGADAGCVRVPA